VHEVRPFEGSPEELSDFVVSQWNAWYSGRMFVPRWSGDYFRWQLRMDDAERRRHLIAAYQGTRLVGVVLHFPMQFATADERFAASQASWMSVSPAFRGQGVASALHQSLRALHRELGLRFQLLFAYYGHRASLGPKWLRTQTANTSAVRKTGFWVRVLDPARAAGWDLNRAEGWLTRLATPLFPILRARPRPNLLIRAAEYRDLPRCLELANQSAQHCDLRLVWDADSLSRQLGLNGFSHALVAEEHGAVRGFITFHMLPILGRTEAPIGILDLVVVSELSWAARNELLDSVLMSLQGRGAIAALKLRVGDYPSGLFLRWGWFPRPPDSHVLVTWPNEPQSLPPLRRIHVLWR
jgi:GNAT superfamily N-acetyltransferase